MRELVPGEEIREEFHSISAENGDILIKSNNRGRRG